jgi:hypothetical protein
MGEKRDRRRRKGVADPGDGEPDQWPPRLPSRHVHADRRTNRVHDQDYARTAVAQLIPDVGDRFRPDACGLGERWLPTGRILIGGIAGSGE